MSVEPLAQDYAIVGRNEAPDRLCDDPALLRLPGGRLLATYTIRGKSGAAATSNRGRFRLARSDDDGRTWAELAPLDINMGMPFVHDGALYLLGNGLGRRNVIVLRSDDEGETWSDPATVVEGEFWNAPTGYAVSGGRLYRAFGAPRPRSRWDRSTLIMLTDEHGAKRHTAWPDGMWDRICVVAGDLSKDLLDPAAWRLSNHVTYPGTPPALSRAMYSRDWDHWLEPNVVNVRGRLRVIVRARIDYYATSGMCAICDLADDGERLEMEFTQFHPMPGGQNKFHIVFDEVSGLYWNLCNLPTDSQNMRDWEDRLIERGFKGRPGNERRFLMLFYSLDALNWFQAGCVAAWPDPKQSFHYATPWIDGDDMLVLSRTSKDAPNQHDSDLVTFHRVKNFRALAMDLKFQI